MRPEKVTFYIYAERPEEAARLQDALHDFVMKMYNEGSLVTAEHLTAAINKFKNNPIIKQFLK